MAQQQQQVTVGRRGAGGKNKLVALSAAQKQAMRRQLVTLATEMSNRSSLADKLGKSYKIRLFIPKGDAKMLYTLQPELTQLIMKYFDRVRTPAR